MVALTSCMLMLVAWLNMCGAVLAMGLLALEEGGALSVDAGVAVVMEGEGPGGVGFCRSWRVNSGDGGEWGLLRWGWERWWWCVLGWHQSSGEDALVNNNNYLRKEKNHRLPRTLNYERFSIGIDRGRFHTHTGFP